MKFIFIVQGEGRGHMTQAISLFNMLSRNGHQVSHVIIGKSQRRELPQFFKEKISCPITQLESPNFITDKKQKSISFRRTVFNNLRKIKTFIKSVNAIDRIVKDEKPDAIINFYDFLSGFYFLLKNPGIKHVAVAHQFLLNHSSFEFPKGKIHDKQSILLGNRLASFRADTILALSFQSLDNDPRKKLVITPPLLREEVKTKEITSKEHFLIYMVNHGYSIEVEKIHKEHPEISIHCFWDKKGEPEELKVDDTLTFHQLNDQKFISYMASCRGYLTTAGFESVCEAMYMGKPVLMVPVEGHYEQACNALDAKKAGAGISSKIFNLAVLLDYLPKHQNIKEEFTEWCDASENVFLREIIK